MAYQITSEGGVNLSPAAPSAISAVSAGNLAPTSPGHVMAEGAGNLAPGAPGQFTPESTAVGIGFPPTLTAFAEQDGIPFEVPLVLAGTLNGRVRYWLNGSGAENDFRVSWDSVNVRWVARLWQEGGASFDWWGAENVLDPRQVSAWVRSTGLTAPAVGDDFYIVGALSAAQLKPEGGINLAPGAPAALLNEGGVNLAPTAPEALTAEGGTNLAPAAPGQISPEGGVSLAPAAPAQLVPESSY